MVNPFEGYRVTSPYGWRRLSGVREFHSGIDLVKAHKAPIYSFTAGTVIYAGLGKSGTGLGNLGNVVVIRDKNGRGQLYAHLDRVAVKAGTNIKMGQFIGYQGATGRVTGSHLHYEVRKKTAPSYGWESDEENSTLEPTAYLRNFDSGTASAPNKKYIVKAGDTLSKIAQQFNTTVKIIQAANNISNPNFIRVGQVLTIPNAANPVYYTVKSGNILSGIARKCNTTVAELVRLNNITNVNVIQIGQKLRVK
ncbi:LysM peptidoglycan-binding domain-containing protein [Oceanobacillus luteolus]|uniref:LysM peptidoglycan-binding domain-containing protein n=1 Tax=Oceanobacillus luteolus TaxID=1274358 RepID=A0ABW4HKY2_9BACI